MKFSYLIKSTLILGLSFSALTSWAQNSNDDVINLLLKKNVISEQEADSLRSDEAIKEQQKKDNQKTYPLSLGKALNLSGLLQTRYQSFQKSSGIDGFDIRRARLDLKGAITSNWDYELYIEFAGTPALLDGYTTYKFADYLKVSAGQFKIPFSIESLTSDSQLELIDRSQVEEALNARAKDVLGNQNGRDIGGQVSGSFLKLNDSYLFDYTVAVFNGNGINKTADVNNNKDLAGRFSVHPIKNLVVSYDFYQGHDIFGTLTTTQVRNRRGVDARYVYGGLSLTAEYDRGTDGVVDRDGWYGQAAYFIFPKKLQLAAKYDTYDPTKTSLTDRSTWYIGGINYFINNWTKFAVDYSYKREEVSTAQTPNNLFSAELQVQF
jgi:phosphate-selective porin OprO/OprP